MEVQWTLVLFTLFTGLGAGTFAFVATTDLMGKAEEIRSPGSWMALISLAIGGVSSVFHLAHPERALLVLSRLGTNVGREFALLALTGLVLLLYMGLTRRAAASTRMTVAAIGLLLSAALAFTVGATYMLPGRPAWNTFFLPLTYLVSALVLGVFTGYVLLAWKRAGADLLRSVGVMALGGLVLEAVVVGFYAASLTTPAMVGSVILTGSVPLLFWFLVVAIGLVIPTLLMLVRPKGPGSKQTAVAGIALLSVVAGGLTERALMFLVGAGPTLGL